MLIYSNIYQKISTEPRRGHENFFIYFMYVHNTSCAYMKFHVRTRNSMYEHRTSRTYMKLQAGGRPTYMKCGPCTYMKFYVRVHEVKKKISCPPWGSVRNSFYSCENRQKRRTWFFCRWLVPIAS